MMHIIWKNIHSKYFGVDDSIIPSTNSRLSLGSGYVAKRRSETCAGTTARGLACLEPSIDCICLLGNYGRIKINPYVILK